MSIETVSVEQTLGKHDEAEIKRWDEMGEWVWGEMGEVWSRRSPSGCGDAILRLGVGSNHHVEAASLAGTTWQLGDTSSLLQSE